MLGRAPNVWENKVLLFLQWQCATRWNCALKVVWSDGIVAVYLLLRAWDVLMVIEGRWDNDDKENVTSKVDSQVSWSDLNAKFIEIWLSYIPSSLAIKCGSRSWIIYYLQCQQMYEKLTMGNAAIGCCHEVKMGNISNQSRSKSYEWI